MKLTMAAPSPFVRKVRVTVHEAGLAHRVEEVTVGSSPMEPDADAISANPLGKIPALIREDGPSIYDSRVICRYLDDLAGAGLYPESRLWEVLTLEATADGIMEAAVLMVYEKRFKGDEGKNGEWIEAQWGKVTRALGVIEGRWMSHLSGKLNMGQIGVGCALGYLDFRHADRDWRAPVPALAEWYAGFAERESMVATAPEG